MKKATVILLCAVLLFLGVFFGISANKSSKAESSVGNSETVSTENPVSENTENENEHSPEPTVQAEPDPTPDPTPAPTSEPEPEESPDPEIVITEDFTIELGETEDIGGF